MKYRKVTTAAAAALIAGAGLGLAGTAGASTAARHHPPCAATPPSGDTYHVIPRGDSLLGWADAHAYGLGNVLSATIQCGPGIQSQLLFRYIDAANFRARLPHQVAVWVPFGSYHK